MPTGRRVPYSPTGYEYDVYNLCSLAPIMTVILCVLGNDRYETTVCFGTTKTRQIVLLATIITDYSQKLSTMVVYNERVNLIN